MTYRWSALTDADTPQWSELVNLIAEADGTEEMYSPQDLAEELTFPHVDPALDTVAVRDRSGSLVAFGQLFYRDALVDGAASAATGGGVHPDHRGRGLGTELMQRLADRAVVANRRLHPGVDVVLRADTGVQVGAARALLRGLGFTESRYFHEMEHDLAGVGAFAAPVDGIRGYRSPGDDLTVHDAHTSAFATHWRAAPLSDAEWQTRVVAARPFRPALSFVRPGADAGVDGAADSVDGAADSVDGYVLCEEFVAGELYVGLLGVVPGARGRGTGTALLRTVLGAAVAAGYRKVSLDVDSDNVTGAGHLYEAAGFRRVRSTVSCLKTLPVSSAG